MTNRANQLVFIFGLTIFTLGQFWIYYFGATNKTLSSIDVSHWLMLIGATLYLPFAMNLHRTPLSIIATVLMTIGVICMVGMCVIDLVLWAIGDEELRTAVARELINTPSVWQPFMLWGNEEVLMSGFMLASLLYIKQSKVGPILVILGSIVAIAGASWFNFWAYIFVTIGFLLCFDLLHTDIKSGKSKLDASL